MENLRALAAQQHHVVVSDINRSEGERFAINVTGTLLCCQHAARLMQRNSFGRIINIASVAEMRGQSAERPSKKEAAQRAAS